jgi:hypothetical protein
VTVFKILKYIGKKAHDKILRKLDPRRVIDISDEHHKKASKLRKKKKSEQTFQDELDQEYHEQLAGGLGGDANMNAFNRMKKGLPNRRREKKDRRKN